MASGARMTSVEARAPALLLAAHALVWLAVLAFAPPDALADDIARFVQVATSGGIPYRDFPVEYMPLETLLIGVLGGTVGEAGVRVVAISAVSDVAVYLLIARLFGRRAALAYLWFALPLQVFMLYRLDLVAVVAVLAALLAAREERPVLAGVVFAAAVLFKPWPLVILPVLAWRAGRRGVAAFAAVILAAAAAWFALGGLEGIRSVVTFRGATGWQIESAVGAVLGVVGDEPARFELGAMRIGQIGAAAMWLLRAGAVAALATTWWKARAGRWDPAGAPSAAAIAVLVATSPVASAQYVAWLVPWCAVAVTERRRVAVAIGCTVAAVLAAASFSVYWGLAGGIRALTFLSLGRAVAVVTIAIAWLVERTEAADG